MFLSTPGSCTCFGLDNTFTLSPGETGNDLVKILQPSDTLSSSHTTNSSIFPTHPRTHGDSVWDHSAMICSDGVIAQLNFDD